MHTYIHIHECMCVHARICMLRRPLTLNAINIDMKATLGKVILISDLYANL